MGACARQAGQRDKPVGDDLLVGGAGGDALFGGAGADTFDFDSVGHSRAGVVGGADLIVAFEGVDVMDLATIDANKGAAGDQAFRFIGAGAFSGRAGELRFEIDGFETQVLGDVNGDRQADLQITLLDPLQLNSGDFVL